MMDEGQVKLFADISVADAAISNNENRVSQIDGSLSRLSDQRAQINLNNNRLAKDRNDWAFQLMLSMSHRQFCRLMGF